MADDPEDDPPDDPFEHPPDDELLEDYRALNDPDVRRRVERWGGYFVVEGPLALEALCGSRYPVRSVLASDRAAERGRRILAAGGREGVRLVVRPEAEMEGITGFPFHRGLLAAADRLPLPEPADLVRGARRVAVLEGLGDHENLGALFRNAAAFGVGAVLLDPTTADPLYRRSVRVSLGHVLRVGWARLTPWPAGLAGLRDRGFTLVALTPAADAEPLDALAADPPERIALLLGAEGPGLTPAAQAAVDRRVRIPLAPGVDSLNVATAAAIAFHRLLPPPGA